MPQDSYDKKGILDHSSRLFAAGNRKHEASPLTRLELRKYGKFLLLAPKPAMRQTGSQKLERVPTKILHVPGHEPSVRVRIRTA